MYGTNAVQHKNARGQGELGALLPWLALALSPVLAAYGIMLHFAVNLPVVDDYHAVLDYALNYQHRAGVGGRLRYLFDGQHGDYKLVLEHFAVALNLLFARHVNFLFLEAVGDVFLLGILWVLWRTYFPERHPLKTRLLLFLPVIFLLFSLNYGETVDFASAGLDFIPAIFFSLAAIYLLTHPEKGDSGFFLATCAALLGYFSAPNSFLLLPIGLYLLVPRRRWGFAAVWCVTFAIGLAPYFYHYSRLPRGPRASIFTIPVFFVAFLGGSLGHLKPAIPMGVVVLLIFLHALWRRFDRINPAAFFGVVWVLGSGAMAAVGRSDAGVGASMAPRYTLLSEVVLIFCYGYLATRVIDATLPQPSKRRMFQAALAISVLFCAGSDWRSLSFFRHRRDEMYVGLERFRMGPAMNSPLWYSVDAVNQRLAGAEADARTALEQSIQQDLYVPPADLPPTGDPSSM